jgi:hypothetical protein
LSEQFKNKSQNFSVKSDLGATGWKLVIGRNFRVYFLADKEVKVTVKKYPTNQEKKGCFNNAFIRTQK